MPGDVGDRRRDPCHRLAARAAGGGEGGGAAPDLADRLHLPVDRGRDVADQRQQPAAALADPPDPLDHLHDRSRGRLGRREEPLDHLGQGLGRPADLLDGGERLVDRESLRLGADRQALAAAAHGARRLGDPVDLLPQAAERVEVAAPDVGQPQQRGGAPGERGGGECATEDEGRVGARLARRAPFGPEEERGAGEHPAGDSPARRSQERGRGGGPGCTGTDELHPPRLPAASPAPTLRFAPSSRAAGTHRARRSESQRDMWCRTHARWPRPPRAANSRRGLGNRAAAGARAVPV